MFSDANGGTYSEVFHVIDALDFCLLSVKSRSIDGQASLSLSPAYSNHSSMLTFRLQISTSLNLNGHTHTYYITSHKQDVNDMAYWIGWPSFNTVPGD